MTRHLEVLADLERLRIALSRRGSMGPVVPARATFDELVAARLAQARLEVDAARDRLSPTRDIEMLEHVEAVFKGLAQRRLSPCPLAADDANSQPGE